MEVFSVAHFIFLLAVITKCSGDSSPMVAFLCNKPAMYLTENGWQRDEKVDCLKEPSAILSFCKKVYPSRDVTNVVESSKSVTINNWCQSGKQHCQHSEHRIQPFKCLTGPFQSEALLVPEHCIFDHIHDEHQCKSSSEWRQTATNACLSHGMKRDSSAPLSMCGLAKFYGVEFVCCPDSKGKLKKLDASVNEEEADGRKTEKKLDGKQLPTRDSLVSTVLPTVKATEVDDFFSEYMRGDSAKLHDMNEHEYYTAAKSNLQKRHHNEVNKMMKEWAAARQSVQNMKVTNPAGADRLNKDITARFQKTYEALEQKGMSEKRRLTALHLQRVQLALNEKKRQAMEAYMNLFTEQHPNPSKIVKALKHYIKVEQRDRQHAIDHYEHVEDTDEKNAENIRPQVLDHLNIVEKRIQQAIDMLSRIPDSQVVMKEEIDEYLKTFHELDEGAADIAAEAAEKKILEQYQTTTAPERSEEDLSDDDNEDDDDDDDEDDNDDDDRSDEKEHHEKKVADDKDDDDEDDNDDDDEKKEDEKVEDVTVHSSTDVLSTTTTVDDDDDDGDDERNSSPVTLTTHQAQPLVQHVQKIDIPAAAHQESSVLHAAHNSISKKKKVPTATLR